MAATRAGERAWERRKEGCGYWAGWTEIANGPSRVSQKVEPTRHREETEGRLRRLDWAALELCGRVHGLG